MERAFVLINCDTGSEKSIIEELKQIDSIKEIHGTLGVYDIIVKVESENQEKINKVISENIRKLIKIKSTMTLMDAGDMGMNKQLAELIPDIIPDEKKPLEVPTDINDEEDLDDEEEDDFEDDDDYDEKNK
ncbi:MAG TPA: Lrp/AsnC ligand binding domain-containing protein [Nitrosopumilaceae archaeon]|nr:Lrp/AsnC ligand binding domain-containing protein [Nitrosopumilaceae archaeon]